MTNNKVFKMRVTKPEAGNKYYITKSNGGYSNAIKGNSKYRDADCDVLPNCVGYAYGRFNEIGGYGYCKYLTPSNAENFIQYKNSSLVTGQTPKVGACMVWQKGATLDGSDGAGHVAIVEKVISETEVYTSESGWSAKKPFWNQTRKKGSGNWGQNSAYKFLGFIYNPAVPDNVVVSGDVQAPISTKPTNSEKLEFKVGDIVEFSGNKHYKTANALSGVAVKASRAKITNVCASGKHQYHCRAVNVAGEYIGGVYGWVDANALSAIKVESKPTVSVEIKKGDIVTIVKNATYYGGSKKVPNWVIAKKWIVRDNPIGSKVIIDKSVDGKNSINSPIDAKYLTVVDVDEPWTPKEGDIVIYNGNKHYANANAVNGSTCKGGKAKITNIFQLGKSKHPYHLVRIAGSGSTVYGWVDEGSFAQAV